MASQRRCNQRLAVVRCRHRFLSCCPSGNCLFPPLKRAKEQMGGRPWSESQTPWHFGGGCFEEPSTQHQWSTWCGYLPSIIFWPQNEKTTNVLCATVRSCRVDQVALLSHCLSLKNGVHSLRREDQNNYSDTETRCLVRKVSMSPLRMSLLV